MSKVFKNIAILILILACLFNVTIKLVGKAGLKTEIESLIVFMSKNGNDRKLLFTNKGDNTNNNNNNNNSNNGNNQNANGQNINGQNINGQNANNNQSAANNLNNAIAEYNQNGTNNQNGTENTDAKVNNNANNVNGNNANANNTNNSNNGKKEDINIDAQKYIDSGIEHASNGYDKLDNKLSGFFNKQIEATKIPIPEAHQQN